MPESCCLADSYHVHVFGHAFVTFRIVACTHVYECGKAAAMRDTTTLTRKVSLHTSWSSLLLDIGCAIEFTCTVLQQLVSPSSCARCSAKMVFDYWNYRCKKCLTLCAGKQSRLSSLQAFSNNIPADVGSHSDEEAANGLVEMIRCPADYKCRSRI